MDAMVYSVLHRFNEDLELGPKCEECGTPMGEPVQTLHTDDWEYEYYDCPDCGHENVVY